MPNPASTLNISGTITGLTNGTFDIAPPSWANASATGPAGRIALSSGATTISVPSGAVGVLITPIAGNTVALTFKGNSADVGVPMHPTNPTAFALGATATQIVIQAASATTVEIDWL